MVKNAFLMIACALAANCITEPEEKPQFSFSFPLQVGNRWVYEKTWTLDDSLIDSVILMSEIIHHEEISNDNALYTFGNHTDSDTSEIVYESRDDGLYLHSSEPGGTVVLWKSVAEPITKSTAYRLLVPYFFREGDQWVYDTASDEGTNSTTSLRRTFIGKERITTGAGSFDCFVFETQGSGGGARYHYFADGVGLVKKVVKGSLEVTDPHFESVTKKSVSTFSLVSYHP